MCSVILETTQSELRRQGCKLHKAEGPCMNTSAAVKHPCLPFFFSCSTVHDSFIHLVSVVPHVCCATHERVHVCANALHYQLYVSNCGVLSVCRTCGPMVERFLWEAGWCGVGARSCKCGRLCVCEGRRGGRGVLDVACCRHKGRLRVNTHSGSSGSAAGSRLTSPSLRPSDTLTERLC